MKQSQWTIAALVLAVMVFALTFASNYLGRSPTTASVNPDEDQPPLELEFPLGRSAPTDGSRLEQEEGIASHRDFWFVNRNPSGVIMGLDRTNCKCSEVEAYLLPAGDAPEARRLIAGRWPVPVLEVVPEMPPEIRFFALAELQGRISGLRGARLKKEVQQIEVPAGAVGLLRLHWSGERPGRDSRLEANIWMGNARRGRLATLDVRLVFYEPIRVKVINDPYNLEDDDLQKGVVRTVYAWSSTRQDFQVEARLSSVAPSPTAEPLEIGPPVKLTPEERAELARANAAESTPSNDLTGQVLCAYRIPVKLRPVSADGKTPFPIGPFARNVLISSRDARVDQKSVTVGGRVKGLLEIAGKAVIDESGGIDFLTFRKDNGKKETVVLESEAPGLVLEVDTARTAKFLAASLRTDAKRKGDRTQRWYLQVEVRPGQALGTFPRRDSRYEDSAVYLKAITDPKKPPRPIRISVRGNASLD